MSDNDSDQGEGDPWTPEEGTEFGEWNCDPGEYDPKIQNQCSALEEAKKEERTLQDGPNFDKDVALGGQLVIKFEVDTGKFICKRYSAHIIRRSGDNYIALTARTNLYCKVGQGHIKATEGYFFLQQTDKDKYLARFKFDSSDVTLYPNGFF